MKERDFGLEEQGRHKTLKNKDCRMDSEIERAELALEKYHKG